MNLEENATSRWNYPSHLQLPEQPSSRFIDWFIRLKTTYWNRGYAVTLLGIIGLSIMSLQWTIYYRFIGFSLQQNKIDYSHILTDYISYRMHGYYISLIPGGVLATIYPAHNIFGICVAISSIGHLIAMMTISYLNTLTHLILQCCIGATMAGAYVSMNRIWTYWVPLNKQSIRHIPFILYALIYDGLYIHETFDKLHDTNSSYTLTLFIGVIGLAWYVLWSYVINGNYSFRNLNYDFILFGGSNNSRYLFGTYGVSLTRSIVSDIPWKSIFTSKPVLAIALLYVCDAGISQSYPGSDLYGDDFFDRTMRNYTIILLLLFVVLVELVPEITVSISTSNVRKFWSCSHFGLVGIFFILDTILGNTLRTNKMCQYLAKEMQYLYYFGFYTNALDIAPKYASVMYGFLLNIYMISEFLLVNNDVNSILSFRILTEVESAIVMAIICFAAAVFYAIFASAEIQPWAADEPVEENQQNMVENDN